MTRCLSFFNSLPSLLSFPTYYALFSFCLLRRQFRRAPTVNYVFFCKFRSAFVWVSGMFPAFRCNYYRLTTGRRALARVAAFPGLPSATGRVPFGRPVGSSRTLTTGLGAGGAEPTALCWENAGR